MKLSAYSQRQLFYINNLLAWVVLQKKAGIVSMHFCCKLVRLQSVFHLSLCEYFIDFNINSHRTKTFFINLNILNSHFELKITNLIPHCHKLNFAPPTIFITIQRLFWKLELLLGRLVYERFAHFFLAKLWQRVFYLMHINPFIILFDYYRKILSVENSLM